MRSFLHGQAMNLREITKKVGRNIGLNLPAVQLFTKQLLLALHHFRDCGVLHADIKPDNILINDRHNAVKVRLTPAVMRPEVPTPRSPKFVRHVPVNGFGSCLRGHASPPGTDLT